MASSACAACGGRRYQARVAAVKVVPPAESGLKPLSISDLLDATVEEAVRFLDAFADSKPAGRARAKLALLSEVGLGYLRLGQPLNTLSTAYSFSRCFCTTKAAKSAGTPRSWSPGTRVVIYKGSTGKLQSGGGVLLTGISTPSKLQAPKPGGWGKEFLGETSLQLFSVENAKCTLRRL